MTEAHRAVEVEVVAADTAGMVFTDASILRNSERFLTLFVAGYARTYIISPSQIYGIAKNGLTEAGIQNPYSIVFPLLIRVSLDRGQGGMICLGKNK